MHSFSTVDACSAPSNAAPEPETFMHFSLMMFRASSADGNAVSLNPSGSIPFDLSCSKSISLVAPNVDVATIEVDI